MLAPLQTRFDALEQRRCGLLADLGRCTAEQRAFRPTRDAWSLDQVAHHLVLVEQGVLRALSSARPGDAGPPTLRHRVGTVLVRLVFALGIRVRVPLRSVLPASECSLADVQREWDQARLSIATYLDGLDAAALRRPLLRHPIAGPMNALQGLDFLTRHFDHHLRQVRRIRSAPAFPA